MQLQMRYKIALILGCMLMTYQNCAYIGQEQLGGEAGQFASSSSKQAALEARALAILKGKCVSCHNVNSPGGGISYIADINALKFNRYIIPGEPQLSQLYDSVAKSRMPMGSSLTQEEIQAIYDWIYEGMTPGVIGVTPPAVTVLEAKFASINSKILQPKCLGCHSSANSQGGVNVQTYQAVMNLVQPGNPAASGLYDSTLKNRMPKNGTMLTGQELKVISDWIIAGAPNN